MALALGIAASSWAGTFNAFGTHRYTRSTGAPIVDTATFTVLDPTAQYELRIANELISSAVISLNGTEIFGPSDFNQQVTSLVKPVSLLASNTLSVELRSGPGESIALTVVGFDDVPPMIRGVLSPLPNAAGWNNSDVTVTFACFDQTSGIDYCPPPVVVSAESGGQEISGTARDKAANAATARVTVNLDKSAPTIQITSPLINATLPTTPVAVAGDVSDNHSGVTSVSCNGVLATLSSGHFDCSVPLLEGQNTIRVEATDAAGNHGMSELAVSVVTTPRVTITEPANFVFLNMSPITVRGTVTDPAATVQINGITATQSGGMFIATVPLVEGNNTLTAVARSVAGRIGTGSVQVTLDTTPPRVTISSPHDQFETSDSSIAVAGMVNDIVVGTVNDQQAQVTVNGVAAQVSNRTYLLSDVSLAVGPNTIQVIARDRVGNSGTASVTIVRASAAQALIRVARGNSQSGAIGAALAQPIFASLTDAFGQPVANKPVVFKVTEGDGQLNNGGAPAPWVAVYTDAQGLASAQYILGTRAGAGNNKVEATATGFAGTALFVASATPATAGHINIDAGLNQTGATGQPLPFPFVVVVTDAGHNRLAGVPVTFAVTQGGGSFAGPSTITTQTDSDGRALAVLTLGPEAGFDSNGVEATFPGNTGNAAAFTASAKISGPEADTKITGIVLDNSNNPIIGATVRLYRAYLGSNSNLPVPVVTPVVTDTNGQFVIASAPVGAFKLVADGSTVPGSNRYPTVEYDIVTVSGQSNTVGLPIYLPVLDAVNQLCVNETIGGTLTLPSVPGFSLTVTPGSATFPGGSRSGCITVTPVHGDKVPMVPGFGQQPRFVVTIQPVGTHFNPPAQIAFPNVDGLRPREVTEMYSYDHDLSTFVAIGTATVTDDGAILRSDPGVGVLKAGWHCGGNPNQTGAAATCPQCNKCIGTNCAPDPAAATCDDKDKCTENDKCISGACKGTPVDLSKFREDSTFGAEVTLPRGVVDKANQALHFIPGLGGVNFKEATVGFSGQAKDCCDKNTGKIDYGIKEGSLSVSLSADIKGLTLWGPPSISKEFDFGIAVAQIDFAAGVVFDSNFSLSAEGGLRKNECKNETCAFGQLSGSATGTLKATVEGIFCIETWWTSKVCGGLTITPASISISVSAALTYNKPECNSGFGGNITIGKVVFKAKFAVGVPGAAELSFEYEILSGIKIGG